MRKRVATVRSDQTVRGDEDLAAAPGTLSMRQSSPDLVDRVNRLDGGCEAPIEHVGSNLRVERSDVGWGTPGKTSPDHEADHADVAEDEVRVAYHHVLAAHGAVICVGERTRWHISYWMSRWCFSYARPTHSFCVPNVILALAL